MKQTLTCILALMSYLSLAQDTVRTHQRSVTKKTYSSDRTVLMVEAYKTTERAFGLFKPEQISMRDERPMHERGDTLVLTIRVKDKNHPALLYFQNKAKILYKDKFFPHGTIPEINSARVSELEYHSFEGSGEDFLEVKLFGEEYIPSKPSVFRTETETSTTKYFDLDGNLYTADEFRKLTFKPGKLISRGMIRGKEAVSKYGDSKYADGVAQYSRKK